MNSYRNEWVTGAIAVIAETFLFLASVRLGFSVAHNHFATGTDFARGRRMGRRGRLLNNRRRCSPECDDPVGQGSFMDRGRVCHEKTQGGTNRGEQQFLVQITSPTL